MLLQGQNMIASDLKCILLVSHDYNQIVKLIFYLTTVIISS